MLVLGTAEKVEYEVSTQMFLFDRVRSRIMVIGADHQRGSIKKEGIIAI
jgi:hypothetical protein